MQLLSLSLGLLLANVLLGLALLGLQRTRAGRWLRLLGPLHGAVGGVGFIALIVALLSGAPRGVEAGAGSFGLMAAAILVVVLPAGFWVRAVRRRGSDPTLAIGVHATIAVFAVVMLAAYVSAPP